MFIIAPRIRTNITTILELIIREIVIHLGMNPVRGGRPLKDINMAGMSNWCEGVIEKILFIWLLFTIDVLLNNMKIGVIITEYIKK